MGYSLGGRPALALGRASAICLMSTLIAVGAVPFALAESISTCGQGEIPVLGVQGETIDRIGTQKALFIFARFTDGKDTGTSAADSVLLECADCGPGWPEATADQLPPWADTFLEEDDPPQDAGSLSHFFYKMSQGQHKLQGYTLPVVVTSDQTIRHYAGTGGGGIFQANEDLLTKVAAIPGVDFSYFDAAGGPGPDGVVDYVFIHWQSTTTRDGNAVSALLPT